ncbi:amino acid permease [Ascobolus immersus RN42]|uniref:Amino acid permease n=1 Tax=Ascobolus immersus RN42 TaxID=1160509 RepID=A0A3N4IJT9_ASCIM|nr:amino acid permease [Ascobolus immersus RN42]
MGTGSGDDTASVESGGHDLHRGLKSRHITMIAIGGAVGTGLIIGTGKALAKAGPLSILISYTLVGFLVYLVMCALGEMATWLPMSSGFTGYATRFCDPALGFALGYTYWFKYIIVTPNQLTAAALVISYWVDRDTVNPGVWITIFLLIILFINYFGIKFFGEFEFWLSSLKVVTIVGLLILCLVLVCGGGPNDTEPKGFKYWKNPGAIKPYLHTPETGGNIHTGRFLAIWSTMVTATFAYLGTELVGVTVGEAQNPRKTIPRAIKLTFYRILFFYVLSVFFLGMLVPYDSPELAFATKASNSAAASPFVVAIRLSGIKYLPGILNACILIFVFSACNSDLYIASRTIFGLAKEGKAPAFLAKTDKRGVPIYALGVSSLFCSLAYMNVSNDSKKVFGYFVNMVTIFGILTWISILIAHIYFVRARLAQGITNDKMPYVAPFGAAGSWGALIASILIAIFKNFDVFVKDKTTGKWDVESFITGYIGIPLYLIMIFGYKIWAKRQGISTGIKPEDADLFTGKAAIDRQEEEFLANKAAEKAAKGDNQRGGLYKYISWLF